VAPGSGTSTQYVPVVSSPSMWERGSSNDVLSDIPAHCYQNSFEANPPWSSFYAKAPEILEYWKRVAEKHGCRKYMKLGHKAVEARWDPKAIKWKVKLESMKTGEVVEDESDALITALGSLNQWTWPNIAGTQGFEGKLLHSAAWDQDYDSKVGSRKPILSP